MGMFVNTVSFLRPKDGSWDVKRLRIREAMEHFDLEPEEIRLHDCEKGCCLLDLYGEYGGVFRGLAECISQILGDFSVFASCVDSDFNQLVLYHNGQELDCCAIGNVYDEFMEMGLVGKPDLTQWSRLVSDGVEQEKLKDVLLGRETLAENQLRELSGLTGLPIFDDKAFFAEIEGE